MESFNINIVSELELEYIVKRLNEEEIPYTIKLNNDSVLPVFNNEAPFGVITIIEEFRERVEIIYSQVQAEIGKKVKKENKGKKYNFKQIALIIYASIITVVAVKYWSIVNREDIADNFEYVWDYSNTTMEVLDKSSGTLREKHIDNNFNFNFEKEYIYSKDAKLRNLNIDKNDDGFIDQYITYDNDENITNVRYDFDSDGLINQIEYYLKGGDTLVIVDKNQTGELELLYYNKLRK